MKVDQHSFPIIISEYRTSIMGLSMLSIMLFHQYFTSVIPFNFFHNYGHWGVDVFLFLSGMGMINSLNHNPIGVFYIRRIKRLIPSCIMCGFAKYGAYLLISSIIANPEYGRHLNLWSLISFDLWFIPTIIILYMTAPIQYHLIKKRPIVIFISIVLIFILNDLIIKPDVGYNWKSPIGVLSWTIERLPVFSLGMILSVYYEKISNRKILCSYLLLLTAVILKILWKSGIYYPGIQASQYITLSLGLPALILSCIHILKKTPIAIKHIFIFFGTYSLELYLVHEFIFGTIMIYNKNGNPWILLIISLFLSCISAYLCKICTSTISTSKR